MRSDEELSTWYTYCSKKERMTTKHYFKYQLLQGISWKFTNIFKYGIKTYLKALLKEQYYEDCVNSAYKRICDYAVTKRVLSDIYHRHPVAGVYFTPETNQRTVDLGGN